jgi:hypothetical protein
MKHAVLLSWCFLCFITVATAQNIQKPSDGVTGNELREKCRLLSHEPDNPKSFDAGYCAGYIDAAIAVETIWKVYDDKGQWSARTPHFCLPSGLTNGQRLSVVEKWMDDHPEDLNEGAAHIIHYALVKAFPCM